MRAAVCGGPGQIVVERRPILRPAPDQVLLEVRACGLCGTDVHILDGEYPATPNIALGHEYAGVVVEVGEAVRELRPGDRVAIDPNIACRACAACRRGDGHLCAHLEALGVTRDGGFAERCVVPAAQAYRLPNDVDFETAALAEPLSCCLHGLDLAGMRSGERVIVLGAGPIGLLMTQLVRAAGAACIVVADPVASKRDLAGQLGADIVLDPAERAPAAAVREIIPEGADVVLECVGSPATATLALELARRGGTVVWFGVSPPGALWFEATALQPWLEDPKKSTIVGKIGYPPPPKGPCGRFGAIARWSMGIPVHAPHKDAAWAFIAYMTGRDTAATYADKGGVVSRVSTLEDPKYMGKHPEFVRALKGAYEAAAALTATGEKWVPPTDVATRIHERVGAHAGRALVGKVSPEEAVKAAAKEVRDILGKATVMDQPATKP